MDSTFDLITKLKAPAAALAVSGIALASGAAYAQGEAPSAVTPIDENQTAQSGSQLDQMVVYTKGGEKNVMSVPNSVTAISGEALQSDFRAGFARYQFIIAKRLA